MKSKLAFAIAVILALIGSLPYGSVGASEHRQKFVQQVQHTVAQRGKLEQGGDLGNRADRFITDVRTGYAVELRARQLRFKNKPMARAMRDLEKRGLKPAFDRGVSIIAIDKENIFRKTAAQTIVEGDYELTFVPYENGNNSTWEGLIYFTGGGNNDVDYVLLDISSEDNIYVIAEQNYSNNGSGGGGGGEQQTRVLEDSRKVIKASYITSSPSVQRSSRLQEWARCSAAGCWGGAAACFLTGPGWPACAAAVCLGVMLTCAMDAF